MVAGTSSSFVEHLEGIASEAGIELLDFETDTDLELYFDFAIDGVTAGYISKGWSDPGIRVSELLNATGLPAFDDTLFFEFLADRCALQGVMLTRRTERGGQAWLLESVIYSAGLNGLTLRQVSMAVLDCVSLVRNASTTYRHFHLSQQHTSRRISC